MEESGAQVAPPMFIHPNRFSEGHSMSRKRSLHFQGPNFLHQQQYQNHQNQQPWLTSGFQIPQESWDPNLWQWDSMRFRAKPVEPEVIHPHPAPSVQAKPQKRADTEVSGIQKKNPAVEDNGSLRLDLGGSLNSVEEPVSRPSKKVRSGSPGGGNYPMCQVDNCREDLSSAKDYHRRHKVCEIHSKATKALVGKQMQRFCQQCSRFHPLSEFDEGKRSCRRRLAGHNRRRRKTQAEDVSSPMIISGNQKTSNGDLDIVNLLTVLARAQGNKEVNNANSPSVPNKDQLVQILNKINSLPLPVDLEAKLKASSTLTKTIPEQEPSLNHNGHKGKVSSSPSTKDLLGVLSTTLAASNPDAAAVVSQRSRGAESDQSKMACSEKDLSLNMQNGAALEFHSARGERSSTSYQSPTEDSDSHLQEVRDNVPLQLFSSSPENDSTPDMACTRKYFSSDSSNPMEERSPSSSPPIERTLFPLQTTREIESERVSTGVEAKLDCETSIVRGCVTSLELFRSPDRSPENGSSHTLAYQAGYTSSSGSDHSPASLNSDPQDRTGRIIFKLFGKDPSQLPDSMRTQIYNWLSRSPSEMESYIRPGCVSLSIYVSMPSSYWEQLEENLLQLVYSLAYNSGTDFWQTARFSVYTGKQLASYKDGRTRLCKNWRAWSSPEIISVSPLAVVGGQDTTLRLRGRNLSIPGTKIHCLHMNDLLSKEVPGLTIQDPVYDESSSVSFKICGVAPGVRGRYFIEVENGFKGTSFPIIVADATICRELRLLEFEFDESTERFDTIMEEQTLDSGPPKSREEVLHFLNELGWLFQRMRNSFSAEFPGFALTRFKFLFIFSVERNCCALVGTLLDMLLQRDSSKGEPSRESLDMLSEINLLSRAVKRGSRRMVDLLIRYSVHSFNDAKYIFPPNLVGPGGITPLHLAACTSDSEDMVDALTNDPQEIGLHCWNALQDANGLSPYAYASMRNNHAYNTLVARKMADKLNGQVSLLIENVVEKSSFRLSQAHTQRSRVKGGQKSCSKCASIVPSSYTSRRMPGSQGLLHRPYMHSMLAIAAVCVCVCLFLRGHPDIGLIVPFKWENVRFGTM